MSYFHLSSYSVLLETLKSLLGYIFICQLQWCGSKYACILETECKNVVPSSGCSWVGYKRSILGVATRGQGGDVFSLVYIPSWTTSGLQTSWACE